MYRCSRCDSFVDGDWQPCTSDPVIKGGLMCEECAAEVEEDEDNEMKVEQVNDGSWLATGGGYDRPIVAEGDTRKEAVHNFTTVYGNQYAKAQTLTHISLVRDGLYE